MFDGVYDGNGVIIVFLDQEIYFVQVDVVFIGVGVIYVEGMCYYVGVDVFGVGDVGWVVGVYYYLYVEVVIVDVVDDGVNEFLFFVIGFGGQYVFGQV